MCRVLVVNDDLAVSGLIRAALTDDGHEILTAVDGEALDLARTQHPDVILLDLMMPGMGGEEISQHLRAGRPDLAVLAGQLLGVEAEHRTLGRLIAGLHPPNNLTLEPASFAEIDAADTALRPFLTGRRYLFAADANTAAVPLPRAAHVARVAGKYGTQRVRRFL